MKRVLIITARAFLDKDIEEYRQAVIKQMQEGVIILPSGFTYSIEEVDDIETIKQ